MSYNPLPEDINSNVMTRISQKDIFDQVVTSARNTQISASFYSPGSTVEDYLTINTTGTGTATMASGKATFSSGTGTTSLCQAHTVTTVRYTPGFEIYSMFTSTWTSPTSADSEQLLGYCDFTDNGFYIGYRGLDFGIAKMSGGVETFVNRASWNGDLLDGSATSKFTRNGIPEAINLTYLNLFRIRFGWLGAAPVIFEVCTPDGNWITFHTIIQPNTSSNPSIQNPDLPISIRISKTASDSTNLVMTCACFAAGSSSPNNVGVNNYTQQSVTSSNSVNTAIVANTVAAGNASISAIVTGTISVGTITFEASPDAINWFPITVTPSNISLSSSTTHNLASGNFTGIGLVTGYIQTRIRLSTAITGSGSVKLEIRPFSDAANSSVQVFQTSGTNLHTIVDSGTISVTTSTIGNAPTAASVGVASASAVAANSLRKGLILTNTSVNIISLGLNGNTATLNSGITLVPYGCWIMDQYTFTTGAITAIASGAASNLAVQEMQ